MCVVHTHTHCTHTSQSLLTHSYTMISKPLNGQYSQQQQIESIFSPSPPIPHPTPFSFRDLMHSWISCIQNETETIMAIIFNFFFASPICHEDTKAKTESENTDDNNTMFRQSVPQFQKLRFYVIWWVHESKVILKSQWNKNKNYRLYGPLKLK